MKKLALMVGLLLGLAVSAAEERLGSVTGTTAQTLIVGAQTEVCIYCTAGSIRYTVGNDRSLVTASTSTGAPVDFPGDCYRIQMPRGADRLSVIHKDGSSSFTCEVYRVDRR